MSPRKAKKEQELTGWRKAAILFIALGPDLSAQIMKHLKEEEIERIILEIATIRKVETEVLNKVVEEFYHLMQAQKYIAQGGVDYAREILEKALGKEKAEEIINKLTATLQVRPFEFLTHVDPEQIISFLQNEHPQTIALVLAYMPAKQAAQVLSALPEEIRVEVIKRLALMDRTSPEVVKQVEEILEQKISTVAMQDFTRVGGVDVVAEILNHVDRSTEKLILEKLEEENPKLAEDIRQKLFVFEDIVKLDDRTIQRILRDVDLKVLAYALKGAPEPVKEKILRNLSKRAGQMLLEEMEYMGPVRVKDVEAAQQKIVAIIRELEEKGEIVIARGGEEELIV